MKRMIANAAPWSLALKQMYLADFPADSLFEVYGSTELGVNCILRPEDQLRKPGSCGKPAPDGRDQAVRRRRQRGHRHRPGQHRRAVREEPERVRRLLQAARQVLEGPTHGYQTVGDIAYRDDEGYYLHLRPQEGHDHLRRHEHLPGRDRGRARAPSRHLRGRRVRHPERRVGRDRACRRGRPRRAPR